MGGVLLESQSSGGGLIRDFTVSTGSMSQCLGLKKDTGSRDKL